MSWFDASGFTNLASQALKNAQKKIDKVLDIEEGGGKRKGSQQNVKATQNEVEKSQKAGDDKDFWSGWLGTGGKMSKDEAETASSTQSSWNLPWSMTSAEAEPDAGDEGASRLKAPPDKSHKETNLSASSKRSTPVTSSQKQDSPAMPATTRKSEATAKHQERTVSSAETVDRPRELEKYTTDADQYPVLESDSFTREWKDFSVEDNFTDFETSKPKHLSDEKTFKRKDSDKALDDLAATELSEDEKNENLQDSEDQVIKSCEYNDNIISQQQANSTEMIEKDSMQPSAKDLTDGHHPEQSILASTEERYEELAKLDTLHDENSLNTSSYGSFTALSDDSTAELVSYSPMSNSGKEMVAEKPTTGGQENASEPEACTNAAVLPINADSSDVSLSVSNISLLDVSRSSDEENTAVGDATQMPGRNTGDGQAGASEPFSDSEKRKAQLDVTQEYVNVTAGSQSVPDVPMDTSTISSDEILHISTDMDITNSRTSSDVDLLGGRASSTGSSDTSKFDSSIDTVVDRSVLDSQSDVEITEKEPPYSLFGESQHEDSEAGVGDGTTETNEEGNNSKSMSSSYVKYMLEEAMEDLNKTEDSGSDNHSNGEKSESSKVDSELEKSVYSGHESSDEIETTTSSDIEIISAPTPNGDNKYNTVYDLSPLKIALQRTARDQGHNRSDSQSSSSAHSKVGEGERLSPERGEGVSWRDDSDFQHHDLHAVREEEADSPYHPERLLKKLAEMAEVLQARESKLIQLSKENHQLMEDTNILRSQLKQAEEAREAETADLTALTEEFTVRLGEGEKKLQAALKEKEALKQKLESAESELERRSANSNLEAMLEEKREQVEELLKEGEKLSKQQLQSSNIIKKLRAKEKESDTTITSQKKKLDELTKEMERLTTVLDSKEEMEKKQAEAITHLNSAVQRQEKELSKLKSDLEDAQEKSRGLQSALDNSYKEIAELHRSNATQDSKAQEAALSAEAHVREELKAAMEREQQKFRQEREAFIMQVDDLRLDMARLEKEHSRREDLMRQEIAHLQERLQQDEARSQDLSQSMTSATRPLLRQIENLQTTFGAQSAAWERVEKSLTDRLAEAQTALAMAQEKERTVNERHMELSAKVTTLEAASSRLKQEKSALAAQVENDKSRLEGLQDARNSVVTQLESSKQKLSQELTQLKIDQVHLESQLNVERTRLENEKKKNIALEEQLRIAERPRSRGTPSPSPSMSISRQESLAGSAHEWTSPNGLGWSYHDDADSSSTIGGAKTSLYDSLRQSGAAIVVENMSSQLKLREGEITHMQSEIAQLERTRESMARELVNLTNQNEELQEVKKSYEELQEQFKELNNRYSAILQMYGEKEEQVQELRLDLQDVKEMYKTQIDALLAK